MVELFLYSLVMVLILQYKQLHHTAIISNHLLISQLPLEKLVPNIYH